MNTPMVLALLALTSGGIVRFCWQVAGVNQIYPTSYMMTQGLGYTLIAILAHVVQGHPFELAPRMAGLASLGSIFGATTAFAMLVAFRLGGEGSILFPIAGLGVMVSAMLAFVVYREPITASKLLGLGLGVSSIIVLSR